MTSYIKQLREYISEVQTKIHSGRIVKKRFRALLLSHQGATLKKICSENNTYRENYSDQSVILLRGMDYYVIESPQNENNSLR